MIKTIENFLMWIIYNKPFPPKGPTFPIFRPTNPYPFGQYKNNNGRNWIQSIKEEPNEFVKERMEKLKRMRIL